MNAGCPRWQAILNTAAAGFFAVSLFSVWNDFLAANLTSFRLSTSALFWLRGTLAFLLAGILFSRPNRGFDSAGWIWVLVVVGFVWMLAVKWTQHLAFETHAHDLGLFHTTLRNTIHGNIMVDGIRNQIFFADHLMFFLFFLVPFYWIWAGPETLLIASAAAFALGIAAIFRLASERLRMKSLAWLIALAFALNRYVWGAFLHEFHPDFFAPVFYFLLFLAFYRSENLLFFFALFMIFTLREDYALYVIPIGIFFALSKPGRLKGLAVVLLGAAYAYVAFSKWIPFFHELAGKESGYGYLGLWGSLGSDFGDIAGKLVSDPSVFMGSLCWRSIWNFSIKFFFLPFVYLPAVIFWLPPLLLNASSQFELIRQLSIHYGLVSATLAFVASIEGIRFMGAKCGNRANAVMLIVACALALAGMARYPVYIPKKEAALIQAVRLEFKEPVCVQSSLFPHLQPGNFSIFPECSSDAQHLILNPDADTYPLSRQSFARSMGELVSSGTWQADQRLGNVLLFKKKPLL